MMQAIAPITIAIAKAMLQTRTVTQSPCAKQIDVRHHKAGEILQHGLTPIRAGASDPTISGSAGSP